MKYFTCLSITLATIFMTGCKKMDLEPTDVYTEDNFWAVEANVSSALYNNYNQMYNSELYFYNEATTDNAYSPSGDYAAISSGNYTSTLGKFRSDWAFYYRAILSCNIFLENIARNTNLPPATIERMQAETRVIRAFEHYNLAKWYGDVPLVNHVLTPEEAQTIPRTSRATVMKFVTDELEAASAVLPKNDNLPTIENGRITKGAALGLKARVLLFEGQMSEVISVCERLMKDQAQNGSYGLVGNYSDLFNNPTVNRANRESLLSIQYVPTVRTWNEFWDFAPRSVGGRVSSMAPTQELVNDYIMLNGRTINETGSGYTESNPYVNRDPRLDATIVYHAYNWVNADGTAKTIFIKPGTDPSPTRVDEYNPTSQSSSPTGYYWRKYFDPSALPNFVSGENLHLVRYAEILLNYAEAKQALGQMDQTVWNATIRALRARAGFTNPEALNYPVSGNMTNIIRRERRVELVLEGAIRADDIRRWKIAEDVMDGFVHGAQFSADPSVDNGYIRVQRRIFDPARNYLWPIPDAE